MTTAYFYVFKHALSIKLRGIENVEDTIRVCSFHSKIITHDFEIRISSNN